MTSAHALSPRSPARVLIVDDDREFSALLSGFLNGYNFSLQAAHDGPQMFETLAKENVDLILLDYMLPGKNGLSLLQELKNGYPRLPVIMFSARNCTYDRVQGLESGAEDYLNKPFEPRELVARILAILRRLGEAARHAEPSGNSMSFDGWELRRPGHCLVTPEGLILPLSNAEFRFLCLLLETPRQPLRREQLIEVTSYQTEAQHRNVDLLVSRLRQKMSRSTQGADIIKTVRGVGYLLQVQSVRGRIAWRH